MKLARNLAAEVPIATHLFLGLLQAPQQVCVCVEPSRASPGGGIFSPFSPPVCWHQCLVATTAASVRFPGGLGCRGALSSQGLGFFYLHYFFCVRVKTEGMGMCQSPVVCWFDRLRFRLPRENSDVRRRYTLLPCVEAFTDLCRLNYLSSVMGKGSSVPPGRVLLFFFPIVGSSFADGGLEYHV